MQIATKGDFTMTTFTTTLQNRRSIYDLGRNVTLSNEELTALIKEVQLHLMHNQHEQSFFLEMLTKNYGK